MIAWAFMWTTAYCPHMWLAQTDNDIDWYVKQSHLKPSTPTLPRLPCDLVFYNRLCLWLKATEAKTVCPVRDMSMWVMCACVWGGVVLSPLSLTTPPTIHRARTLSISSHYPVTWNHGDKKKSNQLLHLLNESNFLPESTRHAHTSMATLNYLTLIQINKSHHHQDCATPNGRQWQCIYITVWRQQLILHPKMQSQ